MPIAQLINDTVQFGDIIFIIGGSRHSLYILVVLGKPIHAIFTFSYPEKRIIIAQYRIEIFKVGDFLFCCKRLYRDRVLPFDRQTT